MDPESKNKYKARLDQFQIELFLSTIDSTSLSVNDQDLISLFTSKNLTLV